ncbi:MAG: helix-turn-helix transcriptional regulator [Rhodopila sp.]
MSPDSFRACLQSIGWTQRGLADRLGIHETRVRRWAGGQYQIPPDIAAWLERLAAVHARHPVPDGWAERPATPVAS